MKDSRSALGFLRLATISPDLRVADISYNVRAIVDAMESASARGCQLAVFPELSITGYSCADLLYQSLLLEHARTGLVRIAEATRLHDIAVVVGLPLTIAGRLYNCAAFAGGGAILGIIPKTFLPTTNEFYEERWFTPAQNCCASTVEIGNAAVPVGTDLLFSAVNMRDCVIGVEICEDLWSVDPPSGDMALAGATLLLNPSASNELLGKADYRRELVKHQSARCLAAYAYAGSGPGESTTDVVYSGHSLIAENGVILAETTRFFFSTELAVADVDLQRLLHERLKNSSFSAARSERARRTVGFVLPESHASPAGDGVLLRPLSQRPFVPSDRAQRAMHCEEIFNIQSVGLAKRLKHTGVERISIGISGGLDSTLALLVTVKAFDLLGLDREGVVAVTMPGFGTTSRTRGNAERLAAFLHVTLREVPIHESVRQHFCDIGHHEDQFDVTYENAQARERTQILMDVANQIGGFTVGTGDLSELALGWCTFNADHMSMYHVNAGVPKTLVRYLIEWCAESEFQGEEADVLRDIAGTPISPELLPVGEGGELEQKTEESVGPYLLSDFFLFYTVRCLFPPRKVFFLARQAFGPGHTDQDEGQYAPSEILRWMREFYKRFFSQQFKRSAMPDGPKVGSVALSPRGDWRMPSDASSALWLQEMDELAAEQPE